MRKNIENIAKALDAKDEERRQAITQGKQEIAELEDKIKELSDKLQHPDSLDSYKENAQALRDAQEYKTFLVHKKNKAEKGRLLEEPEYKEIKAELIEEIKGIQAEAAPELEQAVMRAVELMTQYNGNVMEIMRILGHANRLYSPAFTVGSRNYAADIADMHTGRANWLQKFVYMYLTYIDEATRLENNTAPSVWCK